MESAEQAKAREAEIERYDVLERPAGTDLQALVELAGQVCDVPHAAINIITGTEQHQIAAVGMDPSICARSDSMCAVVLDQPPLVVPDAGDDPRFSRNPWVDGALGRTRFYASAPLVSPNGAAIGRLCVFDEDVRVLDDEQLGSLSMLAQRVMDSLELRLRTRELEDSLQELTEARDELRRSNEHLTLFAGQVSHDLRTPLTAILANAEMMAGEPSVAADPDLGWMVGAITRGAFRLNEMIEEILTYAREGGTLTVTEVDLGQLAAVVLSDLAPLVSDTGTTVDMEELPTVLCDSHQVYSVLLNLLTNAVKFARPGVAPRIRVGAERAGPRWRVSVHDNGRGIPQDQIERVFVLLNRVDKRLQGTGIGLATVKRVVLAHGGRVGIDSDPGSGTTVWFELPATPEVLPSG